MVWTAALPLSAVQAPHADYLSFVQSEIDERRCRIRIALIFPFQVWPPYTFFLLNGDIELYRDGHLFIWKIF